METIDPREWVPFPLLQMGAEECPRLKIEVSCHPCREYWTAVTIGPNPRFVKNPREVAQNYFSSIFANHPHKMKITVPEVSKDVLPYPPRQEIYAKANR